MIILYKTCTCHLLHTLKDTTTPVLCLLHASHTIHFSHKRKHFSHKSECFWHDEIHFLQGTKYFLHKMVPFLHKMISVSTSFSHGLHETIHLVWPCSDSQAVVILILWSPPPTHGFQPAIPVFSHISAPFAPISELMWRLVC